MSPGRCFSTLGCAELSLEEALALAQRHRMSSIEVRALGGTLELAAYLSGQYGSPAELAGWLRDCPVRLAGFDASLRLVGATPAERAQLVALVPWAEALGVPWLRVFDGGKRYDAAELTQAAEVVGWWERLRRQQGWRVELVVETHDALLTAEAIARWRAAAPGIGILWDAHHTWRKAGEDPVATWRAIRGGVRHIHVKDSVDRPSARHPFTYVLPGDGGFPIAPLLAALRADGYAGAVSLEWERMWHPYLPPLEQALRTAAERQWW